MQPDVSHVDELDRSSHRSLRWSPNPRRFGTKRGRGWRRSAWTSNGARGVAEHATAAKEQGCRKEETEERLAVGRFRRAEFYELADDLGDPLSRFFRYRTTQARKFGFQGTDLGLAFSVVHDGRLSEF